jgi:nitroreductase
MKKTVTMAIAIAAISISIMSCNNTTSQSTEAIIIDNILTRTSVRKFTEQKLTDTQIETLLRAGMAAPTGINLQPWEFIVITDTTVQNKLVTSRVNTMYREAPCLIVVCGDTTAVFKPHDDPDAQPMERPNGNWTQDCSAATENILLAAHAMGLGAVWTAAWPYPERYNIIREVLGIPDKIMPLAVIPVGYPAQDPKPKDKWKPAKIHYNQW